MQRIDSSSSDWNWSWGELPEKGSHKSIRKQDNSKEIERSTTRLGNMIEGNTTKFDRMKSSSNTLFSGMQEEIYLDETEKLDAEMADLYLNQKKYVSKRTNTSFSTQPSTNSEKGIFSYLHKKYIIF